MDRTGRRSSLKVGKRAAVAVATVAGCMVAAPPAALADHVLLRTGAALFNVRLDDDAALTATRPLRVRFKAESFGMELGRGRLFMTPSGTDTVELADAVTTAVTVGMEGARRVADSRRWAEYRPPIALAVTLPTPAPPTPTPVLNPTPPPLPEGVIDPGMPITDRVQQQLQVFIRQQTDLAGTLTSAVDGGKMGAEEAKGERVRMLDGQEGLLKKYYPQDVALVTRAREALRDHMDWVKEHGKFNFEF